jgi:hypothetical protein
VKSTGSFSPFVEHVDHALVRGVAPGEQLAVEQQHVAGLPARDLVARHRIEVHTRLPFWRRR